MFEMIGNTVRDAVVGGTISVIGGDKFANGAQTGAFRYLFNDSFDHLISKGSHDYERTSSAPITEMVPPTTASLTVLPIISNIFFECPDEPR
jgi:hypothetical protein